MAPLSSLHSHSLRLHTSSPVFTPLTGPTNKIKILGKFTDFIVFLDILLNYPKFVECSTCNQPTKLNCHSTQVNLGQFLVFDQMLPSILHFLQFWCNRDLYTVIRSFESSQIVKDQSLKVHRRDLLLHTVFGSLSVPAMVPFAFAEEEGFRTYVDDVNKFKITIPQDWLIGGGDGNGFKSVTAFYPAEASNSSVSLVITGLGADFTRLESFGKVDAFAENLVSGLDRSWQRPPGVSAKLIDCKATKGMYYIEYTLKNPGESERHLYSVLGIANNGWYNRLYTLTGQYIDEESEKYRSTVEKAVASFKLV